MSIQNPGRNRRPWRPERQQEYTSNSILRAAQPCQAALRAYARWLEQERGLTAGTITGRVTSARYFVGVFAAGHPSLEAGLRVLDARGVEECFVAFCSENGPAACRSMQSSLRLFLRFAFGRGWLSDDLVGAVPTLQSYSLSHVPRATGEEDILRLVESLFDESTSARDRAIVLLLVGYGVRRGQVVGLRVGDIDWRLRTITFRRHKGGKEVHHSLTPAASEALAQYLRHERPACTSDVVFLRSRPPYLPLNPQAVTVMVQSRCQRLGIKSANSPHALRHAFACRLLRTGQSVKAIADLLGHRSLSATAVYAKVDRLTLLKVAVDWPEVEP